MRCSLKTIIRRLQGMCGPWKWKMFESYRKAADNGYPFEQVILIKIIITPGVIDMAPIKMSSGWSRQVWATRQESRMPEAYWRSPEGMTAFLTGFDSPEKIRISLYLYRITGEGETKSRPKPLIRDPVQEVSLPRSGNFTSVSEKEKRSSSPSDGCT